VIGNIKEIDSSDLVFLFIVSTIEVKHDQSLQITCNLLDWLLFYKWDASLNN